jgi:hypothetical protein
MTQPDFQTDNLPLQSPARQGRRVLLVRWGALRIHDYYLGLALQRANATVTFLLWSPRHSYRTGLNQEIHELVCRAFEVEELKPGWKSVLFQRLGTVVRRLTGQVLPLLYLSPEAISGGRRVLQRHRDSIVIACEHFSLALVGRLQPAPERRLLYYSLEIFSPADCGESQVLRQMLEEERTTLASGRTELIIQDRWRAAWLLNRAGVADHCRVHFLPVFIPGDFDSRHSDFLHVRLKIAKDEKLVLYFGAYYGTERRIDDLLQVSGRLREQGCLLVFHGSKAFAGLVAGYNGTALATTEFVAESDINTLIRSCSVGIALYDNEAANTRYTAFSSEKITRYLQCGRPFIAYRNETTEFLRSAGRCCELIDRIEDLPEALERILADEAQFREGSRIVYERFFGSSAVRRAADQILSDDLPRPRSPHVSVLK